jgi:hypothetical protein
MLQDCRYPPIVARIARGNRALRGIRRGGIARRHLAGIGLSPRPAERGSCSATCREPRNRPDARAFAGRNPHPGGWWNGGSPYPASALPKHLVSHERPVSCRLLPLDGFPSRSALGLGTVCHFRILD